ncbi:hypothetical protein TGGT1_264190 [Toxoplasma gondii GT1]|uniref:TRUD domain-containing protein n=3 Tax=Toxoplasma gondii TaxID=5811 RepID=S7UXX7_TOXGG|nr:hypothetical protein TGGT1_264190 [Toxoplasma gondii GT1]KAF4640881.1 hypothetical protein TGRH88_066890 [Toxoplasma gondii]RQX71068.1 tRNA pseudouridine synthase [Toxoplasma gondii CAST]
MEVDAPQAFRSATSTGLGPVASSAWSAVSLESDSQRAKQGTEEGALLSLSAFSRLVGISQFVASHVPSKRGFEETQASGSPTSAAGDVQPEKQSPNEGSDRDACADHGGFWGSVKTLFEDFQVYEHSEFDCACLRNQRACSRCVPSIQKAEASHSPLSFSSASLSSPSASLVASDVSQKDAPRGETGNNSKPPAKDEGGPRLGQPCAFGCWCRAFGDSSEVAPLRLPLLVDSGQLRRQREAEQLAEAGGLHVSPSFRLWRCRRRSEAAEALDGVREAGREAEWEDRGDQREEGREEANEDEDNRSQSRELKDNDAKRRGNRPCVSEFETQNIEAFVRGVAWCAEVYRQYVIGSPRDPEASGAGVSERSADLLHGLNEEKDSWLQQARRTAASAEETLFTVSSTLAPGISSTFSSLPQAKNGQQNIPYSDPSKAPCLWLLGDLAGVLTAHWRNELSGVSSQSVPLSSSASPSASPSLVEVQKELRGALHAFVRERLPFMVSESTTLVPAKAGANGGDSAGGELRGRGLKRGRDSNPLDDDCEDQGQSGERDVEGEEKRTGIQDEGQKARDQDRQENNEEELRVLQGLEASNLSRRIAFLARAIASRDGRAEFSKSEHRQENGEGCVQNGGGQNKGGDGNKGSQKKGGSVCRPTSNGLYESDFASTRFPFISIAACWAQQRGQILRLKKEVEENVQRGNLEGNGGGVNELELKERRRNWISLLETAAKKPPCVVLKLTLKPHCRRFLFPPVHFRCTDTASRDADPSGRSGGAERNGSQRGGVGGKPEVSVQTGVSREERRRCREDIEELLFRGPRAQQSGSEKEEFDEKQTELLARLASHPALLDILFDTCRASEGTCNYAASGGPQGGRWPADLGVYLHFILLKVNRDTSNALHMIGRGLRRHCQRSLAVAGTKDKRGITVQRCSVHKVLAPALLNACYLDHPSWDSNVHIAPLGHFSRPQRLGALLGNSFQVVLRNARLPLSATGASLPSSLSSSFDGEVPPGFVPVALCDQSVQVLASRVSAGVATISSRGFLNYFGLQRFGTHAVRTFEVGAALLQGDWKEAVARILGKKHKSPARWRPSSSASVQTGPACSMEKSATVALDAWDELGAELQKAAAGRKTDGGTQGEASDELESQTTREELLEKGACMEDKLSGDCPGEGDGRHDIGKGEEQRDKGNDSEPSLWDILQKTGDPRVALGRLARHQHIEKTLLSSLLMSRRKGESETTGETGSKWWGGEMRERNRKRAMSGRDRHRRECAALGTAARAQADGICAEGSEMQVQGEDPGRDKGHAGDVASNEQKEVVSNAVSATEGQVQRNDECKRGNWVDFEVKDYFRALQGIPADSLQLYVHSAQSVLFNHACTWRWKALGGKVCVGDVVRVRARGDHRSTLSTSGSTSADSSKRREARQVGRITELDGTDDRFLFDEGQGDGSEDEEEPDGQTVKVIETEAEAEQASIYDLVLPLPGADIVYPSHMTAVYRQLASDLLGLSLDAFTPPKDSLCLEASGGSSDIFEGDLMRAGRGGRKGDRKGDRSGRQRGRGRGRGRDGRCDMRGYGAESACGNEDDCKVRTTPAVLSPAAGLSILGVKYKGSYRSLLERARDCQWQLLQISEEAVRTPTSLLLSDVDLLLQKQPRESPSSRSADKAATGPNPGRRSECTGREVVGEVEMTENETHEKDQAKESGCTKSMDSRSYAEQDFRVSWDEPLDSTLVRCMYTRDEQLQMMEQGEKVQGQIDGFGSRIERNRIVVRDGKSNFCLLLRLRLPPGTYFTMALRELMRTNAPDDDELAHAAARAFVSPDGSGRDASISTSSLST